MNFSCGPGFITVVRCSNDDVIGFKNRNIYITIYKKKFHVIHMWFHYILHYIKRVMRNESCGRLIVEHTKFTFSNNVSIFFICFNTKPLTFVTHTKSDTFK